MPITGFLPFPETELAAALDARRAWSIDTLAGWVRCPSTLGNEATAQEYIARVFQNDLGLRARMQRIDVDKISKLPGYSPSDWSYVGRPNMIAEHVPVGSASGRTLVLNGHVDVVSAEPAALWSSPPFDPYIFKDVDSEWMRGRGAGDMKGGTMAFVWALATLRDLGYEPGSKVTVQSVIEEECTGNGALAAVAEMERVGGHVADACLIPEPFDQTILVRQVGVVWFRVKVQGKTTHVLGTSGGVNAIEKSVAIMKALKALEEEANRPDRIPPSYLSVAHPLNLNVGIMRGGDWSSTVPGECTTSYRFGLFPGESLADLRRRVEARVAEVAAGDAWLAAYPPLVEWVGFQAEGCEFDPMSELGRELASVHMNVEGAAAKYLTATCTTDVRFFNLYGNCPATCYGPRAKSIHGADECLDLNSMRRVAEVYARFIARWCGLRKRVSA